MTSIKAAKVVARMVHNIIHMKFLVLFTDSCFIVVEVLPAHLVLGRSLFGKKPILYN